MYQVDSESPPPFLPLCWEIDPTRSRGFARSRGTLEFANVEGTGCIFFQQGPSRSRESRKLQEMRMLLTLQAYLSLETVAAVAEYFRHCLKQSNEFGGKLPLTKSSDFFFVLFGNSASQSLRGSSHATMSHRGVLVSTNVQ